MVCSVSLTAMNGEVWTKNFANISDYNSAKDLFGTCGKRVDFGAALLYPVRTHTLSALVEDLLLPTTAHIALKIHDFACRLFTALLLSALDLVTLPVRLFTCVPRAIYNTHNESRQKPLLKFLRDNNVPPTLLESPVITLRCQWKGPILRDGGDSLHEDHYSLPTLDSGSSAGENNSIPYEHREEFLFFLEDQPASLDSHRALFSYYSVACRARQ